MHRLFLLLFVSTWSALAQEAAEVRVIRPRYFVKEGKFEIGVGGGNITNQTFIYTLLLNGSATFHFSEVIGFSLNYSQGFALAKDEQNTLTQEFDIKTQILYTDSITLGEVLITPTYGKFLWGSGQIIYFDTFFLAGGGVSGIRYKYEHCTLARDVDGNVIGSIRAEQLVSYPTVSFGLGQRFFMSEKSSVRWDIKDAIVSLNSADGSCLEGAAEQTLEHHNVTINLGYSYFL